MFMLSIWPLLPVSMAEMPSIMMLFWLAPPRRVPPADAPPLTTPGANAVQAGEVAVVDRQVLDLLGRDGERALAALRLHERRFGGDVDGFGRAADFDASAPGRPTRSPPLTAMPLARHAS